ncbi:fibronectin type III domain-containing protein [Streptomyces sp. NPDC006334]|uniref:fibronectin type III domain-containing protein n=1 Tax=Streptomyces sp. NPDC006334 TaxID=3156754 RepID=UPI0033A3CF3D
MTARPTVPRGPRRSGTRRRRRRRGGRRGSPRRPARARSTCWSAPTDSHSGSIVRYAVWVYDKSTPMNHSRIIGYPASARSARITGVTAGHEYVILVCAWNASGEGKPSMSDTVVPD